MIDLGFQTDRERAAYAAGIVDGEGTVSITKACRVYTTSSGERRVQPPHCSAHVIVEMVTPETPLWLFETYGGARPRLYAGSKAQHKPSTRWALHGRCAATFLAEIRPFLRTKAAHADLVLGFYDGGDGGMYRGREVPNEVLRRREEFWQQMRDLNARGVLA